MQEDNQLCRNWILFAFLQFELYYSTWLNQTGSNSWLLYTALSKNFTCGEDTNLILSWLWCSASLTEHFSFPPPNIKHRKQHRIIFFSNNNKYWGAFQDLTEQIKQYLVRVLILQFKRYFRDKFSQMLKSQVAIKWEGFNLCFSNCSSKPKQVKHLLIPIWSQWDFMVSLAYFCKVINTFCHLTDMLI